MITSRNYIKLDEKVNSITSIPPRAKILHGEICALSQTDGFCLVFCKAIKPVNSIGEQIDRGT